MGRNLTEADKAEVWQRYGDGASAAMIARTMGFQCDLGGGVHPQRRRHQTQAKVPVTGAVVAG